MDFGERPFGKSSSRAALAGALLAAVALLFALLAGDARAALITPQAAAAPPVTVPNAVSTPQAPASAPAPSEQASGAGGSQPASAGAPEAAATGDAADGGGLPDDALLVPLDLRVSNLGVSIDSFGNLYYDLVTLDNSVLQANGDVRDLVKNLENVQKTLQELNGDIQNAGQQPANPSGTAGTEQASGGDEVSGAGPDAGGPSGDGSGGGSGGGAKGPDGDPTVAAD